MIKDQGLRRHSRVRDDIPVRWYVDQLSLEGNGILRNISISGAMLETKAMIAVENAPLVMLKALESGESIFVPPLARMVWGRMARAGGGYFFYGLEFKDPSSAYLNALASRVEAKSKSAQFGLGSGIADTSWDTR